MKHQFRTYFEATDIFGFDREQPATDDPQHEKVMPMRQFNIELMMDFLQQKSIGLFEGITRFMNEIQWGDQPGAVKLEIDPGFTFYIKKWGVDKLGQNCWITKRMFQLNRGGYGGYEDAIATEIHDYVKTVFEGRLDAPKEEYNDLEGLVHHIASKIRRCAKPIFIYNGIKMIDENTYVISMDVRGHGLERINQRRVEQNITEIMFHPQEGVIRVINYNYESPTGGAHKWELGCCDLDIYFFPTQDREEISECIAVHMKYY